MRKVQKTNLKKICNFQKSAFFRLSEILEDCVKLNSRAHVFWKYLATPFAGWWKSCKNPDDFPKNCKYSLLADNRFWQNIFWNVWTKMLLLLARNLHFCPASIRQMQLCYHWKEATLSFCTSPPPLQQYGWQVPSVTLHIGIEPADLEANHSCEFINLTLFSSNLELGNLAIPFAGWRKSCKNTDVVVKIYHFSVLAEKLVFRRITSEMFGLKCFCYPQETCIFSLLLSEKYNSATTEKKSYYPFWVCLLYGRVNTISSSSTLGSATPQVTSHASHWHWSHTYGYWSQPLNRSISYD